MSSMFLNTKSSLALETTSLMVPEMTWLETVCSQGNFEYIRLMCQAGLSKGALDRAFKMALSNHSMDAIELLLSFGAIASSACQEAIRERVKLHDVALIRLLLSASKAMSVEAWRSCLEPEIQSLEARSKRSPDLLLLCIAHRPEVVCRDLLLKALKSQDLAATAIMLAYYLYGHLSNDYFRELRELACEFASHVKDDGRRHKFFAVLVESEFVADSLALRQELVKDVKTRQLLLIKLLAGAGVVVDMEPHNAFYWAVSHKDFDIVELLKSSKFSSPISLAFKYMPDSTSEPDLLRLVEILGPVGMNGEPMDSCLVSAVRRQYLQLVGAMVRYGASIEFEQASAVQAALEIADLELLSVLLQSQCSAAILSATIPTAMTLKPRLVRLQAMKALVKKGVLPQELGVPLQKLVSEDGDADSELIQFLLHHEAPVDGVGDYANNAVLVAARRGNLPILKALCDAKPRNEALSKAVPVAFGVIDTCGYDIALNMIKLLLQKGAAGLPTYQTLLAAIKQDRVEIVSLLIEHGADANHLSGASFGVALTTLNFKLLQILCAKCPPSQASIESGFFLAVDPRYYTLQALELLLSSSRYASTALNILWSSEILTGNPNISAIVPCLLRHGLDVNIENGVVLSLAIAEKNVALLEEILSANPSIDSLRAAFHSATHAQPRSLALNAMRLLLEKANSADTGQSESLLQQVNSAICGDFAGLQLLLRHETVITPYIFSKACLALGSCKISWAEKQAVFEFLVAPSARVLPEDMSKLLTRSVTSFPNSPQLPQLLLNHGAEIEFETLKIALKCASLELLKVLLSNIKSVDTVKTFTHARKITMASDRRYQIYEILLAKGIPSDDVSKGLLDSLQPDDLNDLSFPKLLLNNGASPGYKNCRPFDLALRAKSPNTLLLRLLAQYLVDDRMATIAFDLVRKAPLLEEHVREEIYRTLLEWNIGKRSVSRALVDSFKSGRPNISFLLLLLAKGADPNKSNGHCFAVAAKAEALVEFQALSKYAKRQVVLKALLNNFADEWEVVNWFKVCLMANPRAEKADQDGLVFQCMSRFPAGTTLLKLLLEEGVSASAKRNHRLCASWKPEPCTALIWALFQKPRIENDVVLVLLSRGDAALPAYSTPETKVSAAFSCLLDKTRLPILEALLDLDRDRISDHVIPGSSLGALGMSPKVFQKDSDFLDGTRELPLREASLCLGNFEAFRLISTEITPNDGILHLAALLALPTFVKWLLKFHDPDHKVEEFGDMVPLALVCESKPHHWSKIANEESNWKKRRKDTMSLLAGVNSPEWRYRRMTILHWAMENGLETAKAMVMALDICHDSQRDEKYLYKDRDGIEYSPQQYAMKVWDANEEDKNALIVCFEAAALKSRYFKRIFPGNGEQPEGYHGLPSSLTSAWGGG